MFKKQKQKRKKRRNTFFTRLSRIGLKKERDYFIQNLAVLMSSGMTLRQAFSAIKEGVRTKRMKKILTQMEDEVANGSSLTETFSSAGIFSSYILSLVAIGEQSGRLPQNLEVISLNEEKNNIFRSKIRSAMMYPIFVLTVTVSLGVGIAWFILPRLALVFGQLDVELPLATKVLIRSGEFLGEYGNIVVPAFLVVLFLILLVLFSIKRTKFIGEWILYHIPGVKELLKEIELARFGYLLGTLLKAGLSISTSLESLAQSTTSGRHKKLYVYLHESILEGNSFYKSLRLRKKGKSLIPSTVEQMINAGEQSGKLPETFLKIGEVYEVRTETRTKNLSVILEPILLVIVWLGVVGIAVAVILPLYSLLNGLN